MAGYDKNLDEVVFKDAINVKKEKGERYLNVEVYKYNGGQAKVRIKPVAKNTNPEADSNKKWINMKAISSIDKDEVKALIKALEKAIFKM